MQDASKAAGQGRAEAGQGRQGRAGQGPEANIQASTEGLPGGLLRGCIPA